MIEDWVLSALAIITVIVLVSASVSDYRRREVSDLHWMVLGTMGIVAFTVYSINVYSFSWAYIGLAVSMFMVLADVIWERPDRYVLPFYVAIAVIFLVSAYYADDESAVIWAVMIASYIVFAGMYTFGIIQGGADAKCLITLSMVFPMYPQMWSLPLIQVPDTILNTIFTFSISTLFLGAILSCMVVFYYMFVNLSAGNRCKRMFTGYMMSTDIARSSHVWPMDDIVDGQLMKCRASDDTESILDRLESAGYDKIWVTPMIPFIIPMTVAALFMLIIGNPLFLI